MASRRLALGAFAVLVVAPQPSAGQLLVWDPLPTAPAAGETHGPLRFTARWPDGGLATVGASTTVVATGAGVLLSGAPNSLSGWQPSLPVGLGAGVSAPIYFRSSREGAATLEVVSPLDAGVATLTFSPFLVQNDFEPGSPFFYLRKDLNTFVSPLAAHRGASGLRTEDTDAGGTGSAVVARGMRLFDFEGPTVFFRGWVRATGRGTILSLETPAFVKAWDVTRELDGRLELAEGSIAGTTRSGLLDAGAAGSWQLIELDAVGIDAADAGVALRVDGQTLARLQGLDLRGVRPNLASFGAVWESPLSDVLTVDVDDLRFALDPMGSTLELQVGAAGPCIAATLRLVDSTGQPRPTPVAAPVALESRGGTVAAFDDPACSLAATLDLGVGQAQRPLFLASPDALSVDVTPRSTDYLSRTTTVVFGVPDGGEADDGGARHGAGLDVRCGCHQSGGPALAALLLALGRWRRARQKHPKRQLG